MNVILLERINGLGELGDQVEVKPGYARNYLIPQKKATEATPKNIELFQARRAELEKQQADKLADAQNRAAALTDKVLVIRARVGHEGKLFGSVGTQNIAEAATREGLIINRQEVMMPHGTIRETGEYTVDIHLFGGISTEITVRVVSDDD